MILLVDDDPSILVAWKRILQLEGYRVEIAYDGEAGLAAANMAPPGLVITDRSMPGMDGIELCRQLKSNPMLAGIPLILTSASHEILTGPLFWNEFWLKPVPIEAMLSSVRRLLALSS